MPDRFHSIVPGEINIQRHGTEALTTVRSPSETRRSVLYLLIAAAIGAAAAAFPLVSNRYAFFIDDMQAYYMPGFYAIGYTLRKAGYCPFLTTQNWYGGNLLAEYQYALYNPVALGLYALLPSFKSLWAGAGFLAIVYNAILASGVFVLARTVRISRGYAYVAVSAVSTNNFIFYWYASSWFTSFSSIAFMVWAMAFILRAHTGFASFVGAALSVYLTVTAGWPHTVVALASVIAIWIIVLVVQGRWRYSVAPAIAGSLGFVSALPAIVPVLDVGSVIARSSGLLNHGQLLPNLGDVLAVSSPFYIGFMVVFAGFAKLSVPIFYAGWFVIPLLVLLDWRNVDWKRTETAFLASTCALFLMATQGPQWVWLIQWPFRFIPYFQIVLVVTVLYLVSQVGLATPSRNRIVLLIAALTITTVHSLQMDPQKPVRIIGPALIIAVVSVVVVIFAPRKGTFVALLMVLTTLGFAAVVRTVLPRNHDIADWAFHRVPENVQSLWQVPEASTFFVNLPPKVQHKPSYYDDILFGQMGLALGVPTIHGYSDLWHKGLADRFCIQNRWTCPEAGPALLQVDPMTQMTYADLMRVDRIVVEKGPALVRFQQVVREPWRLVETRRYALVYERALPNRELPGTLSWPVAGIKARAAGNITATREPLQIERRDDQVKTLIFARLFWPGYRASLDGRPLYVHAYAGFLVAVDLPPGHGGGRLVLWYRPVLFYSAVAASACAVLLLFLGGGLTYAKYAAWRTRAGAQHGATDSEVAAS